MSDLKGRGEAVRMFIGEASARIRRPLLAACLALAACIGGGGASAAWTALATVQPVALVELRRPEALAALNAPARSVFLVAPADCSACGVDLAQDAADLRAAGVRVRLVPLESAGADAPLLNLVGGAPSAQDRTAAEPLRRALAPHRLQSTAPLFVWRRPDGAWRAADAAHPGAARLVAADLARPT